jgi:hypothetical protein
MKKLILITLLIILIGAIGVSVYLLKGMGRQVGKVPTPTQPTLPSQPEIDTSDWKVYRNEDYGFEVRYPRDWVVKDIKAEESHVLEGEYPKGAISRIPFVYVAIAFQSPNYSLKWTEPQGKEELRKRFFKGASFEIIIDKATPNHYSPCNHSYVLRSSSYCPFPNGFVDFPYVKTQPVEPKGPPWNYYYVDPVREAEVSFDVELDKSFSGKRFRSYEFHMIYNFNDYPQGEELFNKILSTFRFL